MKKEQLKEIILKAEKKGKVVIQTVEGLEVISIKKFIKQPIEGLLYDLNRDRATCLTFISHRTWVNNFACMKVIEKLKEENNLLKLKLKKR